MQAIKKINNNVAVCVDGNGHELIAFGKGVGFPQMPYEVSLEKIERTFYNISEKYIGLINELPVDIMEFTVKILSTIQNHLDYDLNPNFVLTLADHIAFAMERDRKNIYVRMPLAYDIEQTYPKEMELSRYILQKLDDVLHVKLQKNELSGIAMAIVSAKATDDGENSDQQSKNTEEILEDICKIIERQTGIVVNRKSFDYARFATHIQYLLDRIHHKQYIDTDNLAIYQNLTREFEEISLCVNMVIQYLDSRLKCHVTEEEKLYLILHINRICNKEISHIKD